MTNSWVERRGALGVVALGLFLAPGLAGCGKMPAEGDSNPVAAVPETVEPHRPAPAAAPESPPTRPAAPPEPAVQRSESEGNEESEAKDMNGARPESKKVRPSALAGAWYPGDPAALKRSIESYLEAAPEAGGQHPMGLVLPHAGHRWSGGAAAHGYATIRGDSYRRIFILAPAHTTWLRGAAVPTVDAFRTPLGDVPLDTEVIRALAEAPDVQLDDRPHAREHAIEIQLPFLQTALKPGFRLVPIIVGELDAAGAERLADAIRPHLGAGDLLIASSDFTHYGKRFDYVPFPAGPDVAERLDKLDKGAFAAMKPGHPEALERYRRETGDTVCGFRPIMTLMSLLPASAEAHLLDYETSGAMTGDYSNSVSYLAITYTGPGWPEAKTEHGSEAAPAGFEDVGGPRVLDATEKRAALKLARASFERYVKDGVRATPAQLGVEPTGHLLDRLGVFVTLNEHGRLRGCIGNIIPVAPLAEGIAGRAIDAAVHDRRFQPVRPEELSRIEVEISVLTTPKKVGGPEDIVIGKHGVVISKHGRQAVYLPQVAPEQGWDVPETLSHLCVKAGLSPNDWHEGMEFRVFEAQVFKEAAG